MQKQLNEKYDDREDKHDAVPPLSPFGHTGDDHGDGACAADGSVLQDIEHNHAASASASVSASA